jgi:hypothetical protein
MAITTNFNITSLNCYPQQNGIVNIVFKVDWILNGTDGQYYTSIPGSTELTHIAGTPFIPFAELTQEQVITWIKATIGDEVLANYEAMLTKMIDEQANPVVTTPMLPWMPIKPPIPVIIL